MRQRLKAEFKPGNFKEIIDDITHVDLEHYPNGEWGVIDSRGQRVSVFAKEEDARECAVASAAMLAANAAAEFFGTKHRVWNVTIEPAKVPEGAS